MPTSATGSKQAGFTLIELMVVITIIALASAAVVFAIPDPRGRVIDEATRFAARLAAARDDAIIEGRATRIMISPRGYAFERRRRGAWQAVTERPMLPVVWASGTAVALSDGAIGFDATGAAANPAVVTLRRDAARATVTIAADGAIHVGS